MFLCIGNAVVIWVVGMLFFNVLGIMLLFVYWECCCYLCIGNDVDICIFGILLLFVQWECCCCLGIGIADVIWVVGMLFFRVFGLMSLFLYWE